MALAKESLSRISPDAISPNPDNPRLIFREEEMNQLLDSIAKVGIKVPLSVYRDGRKYVLVDGERRWRCARKLNMKDVPAIVQPKPGPLENILTMFNIHNVRVDWDLMPMALKLGQVRDMLADEKQPSSPRDLAGLTGVSLPTIRRALELLELPKRYQRLLLSEARKPRDQQQITADLFVEINKSKRVVKTYTPEVFEKVSETQYVDSLVEKYTSGIVKNVVRFRDISRMARAERAGGSRAAAATRLVRLVKEPDYTIERAYSETVEPDYARRDITTRINSVIERLQDYRQKDDVPDDLKKLLVRLRRELDRLLGR